MNKVLYLALPVLLVTSELVTSKLNCGDSASVEQMPQQEAAVERMKSQSRQPYSQGYQDQRGIMERLEDWFKGKSQYQESEGPTLRERASAAGKRAQVKAKDLARSAEESLSYEGERKRDFTQGPTLDERASAAGETIKVKAKEVAERLKEIIEGRTPERTREATQSFRREPSATEGLAGYEIGRDRTVPSSIPREAREGKTWSETWEAIKSGLADAFGMKKPRDEKQA